MAHELGIGKTWMHGIHNDTSFVQSFRQFPREQYICQFTLFVSVARVIGFVTVQIGSIYLTLLVFCTGDNDNPTWCRFLREKMQLKTCFA